MLHNSFVYCPCATLMTWRLFQFPCHLKLISTAAKTALDDDWYYDYTNYSRYSQILPSFPSKKY